MAYNNYFPVTYQPMYSQQYQQPYSTQIQPSQAPVAPQNNNSIQWVQGEAGAKAYPLPPNSNALLMDAECECFYIKSVDASGMPLPLRVFEYKEVLANNETIDMTHSHDEKPAEEYATKQELDDIKRMLEEIKSNQTNQQKRDKGDRNNGKQSV